MRRREAPRRRREAPSLLGGPGACPPENFEKKEAKWCYLVHSEDDNCQILAAYFLTVFASFALFFVVVVGGGGGAVEKSLV